MVMGLLGNSWLTPGEGKRRKDKRTINSGGKNRGEDFLGVFMAATSSLENKKTVGIKFFEKTFPEIPPALPFQREESSFEYFRQTIPLFPPLKKDDSGGFNGFSPDIAGLHSFMSLYTILGCRIKIHRFPLAPGITHLLPPRRQSSRAFVESWEEARIREGPRRSADNRRRWGEP